MTEKEVTDMSKFKIRPYRDGLFKVWELKDMGSGYCWEDVKRVFQTEEEAQKYAKVLETERQLKKFADEHNDVIDWSNINQKKWYLYYNYSCYKVGIFSYYWAKESRVIYFSSKKIAQQAIDTIGEDKIKEYLTYEW